MSIHGSVIEASVRQLLYDSASRTRRCQGRAGLRRRLYRRRAPAGGL